ncbi:hypothetical protein AWW66_12445 [Micromonospora rosaria]|uniref:Uncharacterized protein n=1 Tax=Micromonospora rosaria TaxID=47874 RepID=A0A136PTI3_9ACTN|nr:hypothetical protein [Micromonospora rosaria]KXK61634.1 hypothetical protein AWW66_12445 [Micromonospora rosaria]
MSSTSIDDLLRSEEERPARPERVRGGRARRVVKFLAVTAAVTVVVVVVLRAVGLTVSLEVVVAGVLAVQAVHRVTTALAPPPRRAGVRLGSGEEPGTWNWGASDALRTAVNRWATPLDWSTGRPDRFVDLVQPRLGELADERLRQRHGLTRDSDPVRARALLGERLWIFLETPPRRTPSPRDLAVIVADLENI